MARRLTTLAVAVAVAVVLVVPAAASAASPATANRIPINRALFLTPGSPMAKVASWGSIPVHFQVSAARAVSIAEQTHTMQSVHRRTHPLHVYPFVWRATDPYWYIVFQYGHKIVAVVDVSHRGQVTGVYTGAQAIAPYAQGHYASVVSNWTVLLPASLLFLLPFFDPRRLRRMAHADAVAILAFLVSYVLLTTAHLEPAVWFAYPPLVYLLLRLLKVGFGGRVAEGRLAPLLSMRTLVMGLPLLLAGRIVLSLAGHQEMDVGYESVIGAYRILHHLPIYYNDPNHGDTYGPITYLLYVPFELAFPWKNSLSGLRAADFAAIVFDLGTIIGLVLLGRRLRQDSEGTRFGLILAWAWAACPFTVIGLVVHTNDAMVSMLSVFTLLLISSPALSGAMLGLATAAKFSPGALIALIAAPRDRGWKSGLVCVVAFVGVIAISIFAWLPPQGFGYFWQRTIHFQMTRTDVFSPWALHPTLHPIQTVLEVAAVLLAAAVAFIPRWRSLAQVCALAGAVTIAIQLPATHWYYYYIMWFLPFALVAFVARPAVAPEPVTEQRREWTIQPAEHNPAMAGA